MTSSKLADRLCVLRAGKRIQQKQLAEAIGVYPSMYSKIEKGNRRIKIEQLEIVSNILETDFNELHSSWLADKFNDVAAETQKEVTKQAMTIVNSDLK